MYKNQACKYGLLVETSGPKMVLRFEKTFKTHKILLFFSLIIYKLLMHNYLIIHID